MASPAVCENFADFFAAARAFQNQASNKYRSQSMNGDVVNANATPATKTFARAPSSSDATYTRRSSSSNGSDISATTVESPPSGGSWTCCKRNTKIAPPSHKTLRLKHQKFMAVTKVKISFEEYVNSYFSPSPSTTASRASCKRQNDNSRASPSPTPSSSRNTILGGNTEAVPRTTCNNSSAMYQATHTKALEHPGVHKPSKDTSIKMAPEHPAAHNSTDTFPVEKVLEHPETHNLAMISSVRKAPERPVAHKNINTSGVEKTPEHPVACEKSRIASVSEASNVNKNCDENVTRKKDERVNKVKAKGTPRISSEVKAELKKRIEATIIADKAILNNNTGLRPKFDVPIIPTRMAPTEKETNTYGGNTYYYELPHDTTFASKHTTIPAASIGNGPVEVKNQTDIVTCNNEAKIRFCDLGTPPLPSVIPETKILATVFGEKQTEMENDVTKSSKTKAKHAECGKASVPHRPSPRRDIEAPKFMNGPGGDAAVALPIIHHSAKLSPENALKDDDAGSVSSESNSEDVVVFRRDKHHTAGPRLLGTTTLQPDVADRLPISEYTKLSQTSRSTTPIGNNGQARSHEVLKAESQYSNRSYGSPPDLRVVSNGKSSNSSQNSSSTRRVRTLAEALSPEYKKMTRAERRALAAKEHEEENKRWKAMTPEERNEELQAIQNAQLAEARAGKYTMRARRTLDLEENPATQLLLARQGPGTDPSSQVSQEIRRRVLPEGKDKPILYRPELTEMLRDPAEYFYANGSFVRDDFICTTYCPWDDEHYQNYDVKFRGWLDDTTRLGYPIDTNSKAFVDGTGHCDGMADAFAVDFEDGIIYSLDDTDPENARAHETAAGYAYNMTVRKATEDGKNEIRVMISGSVQLLKRKPEVHPHAPKGKIYLRPVEEKDVTALVFIYNYYIRGNSRVLDGDPITEEDVYDRITEAEKANLPFLVAAEQEAGVWNALNNRAERIYGFAVASPTGASTFYRYAAELQVFVHPLIRRVGTGRCLLDKMLEICDPKYEPKGGYFFDCCPNKRDLYCGRYARYVTKLSYNIYYTDDDSQEYNAYKLWLGEAYGFEESGVLKDTATKGDKPVHTGCLVYKTNIEPLTRRRHIEKP